MSKLKSVLCTAAFVTLSLSATTSALRAQGTVDAIKQRGFIFCGVTQGSPGFSLPDQNGRWQGIDVDSCRAIAAALLEDQDKVRFVPLNSQQRITALQTGEIDVLARNTTWTLQRDASGINFTFPNYYETTGAMLRKDLGVKSVAELKGASVCVQAGSTTELTIADVSARHNLNLKSLVFDAVTAVRQAFFSGRCDVLVTDTSALAGARATQAKNPDDYIVIPFDDKVDALTLAVRHGDDKWFDIVKWSFQAQLMAEQLGITKANVDEKLKATDPATKRFLGVEPGNGKLLGVSENWAYNIVKQVGNYGEVFERNIGKDSPLKLERGPNRLLRDGGIMFPLAFN